MASSLWIHSEDDCSPLGLPKGCKAFGTGAYSSRIKNWVEIWLDGIKNFNLLLVIAGSRTAEVPGISAAGATSESRSYTAIADAELILNGPVEGRRWPLPPLSAGVSPALISFVAARWIGVDPVVIAAGLSQFPSFPYIRVESPSLGPASCVSSGQAMDSERVRNLWGKGFLMGKKMRRPLLIAECVPGGTTTAQAVLTGLGLSVSDLISGSVRNPPIALKKNLVEKGLSAAGLGPSPSSKNLIAAVGDPFQAIAAGLLLGARDACQPVLLGGGSQMLAVLALALNSLKPSLRSEFVRDVSIGTTAWLAEDKIFFSKDKSKVESKSKSPLACLMDNVGEHFEVELLGISSGLRFETSTKKVLLDYELGFVKEGVGAGALLTLAQLNGASCLELVDACEKAVQILER